MTSAEVRVPVLRVKRRLLRCGLVALLACALASMRGQSADAGSTPVNVTGVVVNADTGAAVPRALVQLGGRAMLTGHDGKFEFDQFAETRASLQVTKPGYYFSLEPMGNGSRTLTASDLSAPLTLRLYPEGLLTGTVTAPDGSPLRGVPISAMRKTFEGVGIRWVPTGQVATTNIRGEFRITVSPGEYRLQSYHIMQRTAGEDVIMPLVFPANSSGNASDVIQVHGGDEQHFDLRPSVGRAYTVWVSSESSESSGRGMPMLQVREADGSAFPVGAQISAGNLYRVELPNGSYTLTATKFSPDGQQIAETDVTVAGHDVPGVVLRFQPMPTVPLEVQVDPGTSDNASQPAPSNPYALGLVLQGDSQGLEMGTASVFPYQQNGEVGFRLTPGSYRLVARNTSSQWYVESATYGDRDLMQQDMTVGPGNASTPIVVTVSNQTGTLNGTVSVNGTPGSGWIYLVPASPSITPEIMTASSSSGSYQMTLAPGTYQAIAFDQRYSFDPRDPNAFAPYSSHVKTVEVHAGDKAVLDLDAVTQAELKP